jgi:glycosyltransferase involved in cell wall biosynthesis
VSKPLVSVVVSSYNRPLMLQSALRSVVAQSYSNLEIIVQDDSTNDECGQVVLHLADPRIRYTRNKPALGTISNLRAGYRKCSGKYFSTLNDDDIYGPDYIATMIGPLEADPNFALAFSDHYIIDQEGNIDESTTNANSATFGRTALKEGSVPQPLVAGILTKSIPGMFAVFRKDVINLNDFPNQVSSGYDYWLTYLALREGHPIYYNPYRLTSYRVHAGSQTSSFVSPEEGLRSLRYSEYMHLRFLADPRLSSIHSALVPRLAQIYTSIGFNRIRLGSRREASQHFLASCRLKPTTRAIAGLLFCTAPAILLKKL